MDTEVRTAKEKRSLGGAGLTYSDWGGHMRKGSFQKTERHRK